MHKFVKVNALVVILVKFVEKLIDISLRRFFVNTSLFEVHLEQVGHLIAIQNTIAIFVKRVISNSHFFDTFATDAFRMLVHLHHHFILADEVLQVVLTEFHIVIFQKKSN